MGQEDDYDSLDWLNFVPFLSCLIQKRASFLCQTRLLQIWIALNNGHSCLRPTSSRRRGPQGGPQGSVRDIGRHRWPDGKRHRHFSRWIFKLFGVVALFGFDRTSKLVWSAIHLFAGGRRWRLDRRLSRHIIRLSSWLQCDALSPLLCCNWTKEPNDDVRVCSVNKQNCWTLKWTQHPWRDGKGESAARSEMKALNTHLDAGVYTHQTTYLSKYQSDITIYIYICYPPPKDPYANVFQVEDPRKNPYWR